MIDYPSIAEVEEAQHGRLTYWQRFLPHPGTRYIHEQISPEIYEVLMKKETKTLHLIQTRLYGT